MSVTFRTDRNNNPTAMTTDVAKSGGLIQGQDYEQGEPFTVPEANGHLFYTAKLIGDPLALTIKVIDKIGFCVGSNPYRPRWTYINLPYDLWASLSPDQKRRTIGSMYECENAPGVGTMAHLFT